MMQGAHTGSLASAFFFFFFLWWAWLGLVGVAMAGSAVAGSTSSWVMPGKKLEDGTHYILTGPEGGELVVLIHGIGGYYMHWDGFMPYLEEAGFRVLRYDLLGRGFSDYPPAGTRLGGDEHVAQLERLMTGLGLASVGHHVVGHSMGGAVAALYTARHLPHVTSATFLAPAGLMDLGVIRLGRLCWPLHGLISHVLRRGAEDAWRQDFFEPGSAAEEEKVAKLHLMHRHNPHAHKAFFQSVLDFPLSGIDQQVRSVGQHRVPSLLMWGKQDQAVPFSPNFDRWKSLLSSGGREPECVVLDRAKHGFMIERPHDAWPAIITFMQQAAKDRHKGQQQQEGGPPTEEARPASSQSAS